MIAVLGGAGWGGVGCSAGQGAALGGMGWGEVRCSAKWATALGHSESLGHSGSV